MVWSDVMDAYGKTDKGKIRKNNEDYYSLSIESPALYIVADGMGGHNAGEVASRLAVESVEFYIRENWRADKSKKEVQALLTRAIDYANQKVYDLSRENERMQGMGTTITLFLYSNGNSYFAHVGDSRGYIFCKGKLSQITQDHTLVEQLVQAGTISVEQAQSHPQKNIITNAIGTDVIIKADMFNTENGVEKVLLCTDGLTNHLSREDIEKQMSTEETPKVICENLVDQANAQGGQDNITVIVVDICALNERMKGKWTE